MHTFFDEIKNYPDLLKICKTDITDLPLAFHGNKNIKAIVIGADPTNNGIPGEPGQLLLNTVFGINSKYEQYFFKPQLLNINAINLDKENLYAQNLCRNYFNEQTGKNEYWKYVAELWIEYLNEELEEINPNVPLLITAEKIMKVLIPDIPKASSLYNMKIKLPVFSNKAKRFAFPLYRHYVYSLTDKKWDKYKNFLIEYFK